MTAKEKYEALEARKAKLVAEHQTLYIRIDALRVKLNQIEKETQEAYMKYYQELKQKK
jgi:hypothetical protein